MEGFLLKQSPSWLIGNQKRWVRSVTSIDVLLSASRDALVVCCLQVVLRGDGLSYFKNKGDSEAAGLVLLNHMKDVRTDGAKFTIDCGSRIYHLTATSPSEASEWATAIRSAAFEDQEHMEGAAQMIDARSSDHFDVFL